MPDGSICDRSSDIAVDYRELGLDEITYQVNCVISRFDECDRLTSEYNHRGSRYLPFLLIISSYPKHISCTSKIILIAQIQPDKVESIGINHLFCYIPNDKAP
jgi:hypothetical protein